MVAHCNQSHTYYDDSVSCCVNADLNVDYSLHVKGVIDYCWAHSGTVNGAYHNNSVLQRDGCSERMIPVQYVVVLFSLESSIVSLLRNMIKSSRKLANTIAMLTWLVRNITACIIKVAPFEIVVWIEPSYDQRNYQCTRTWRMTVTSSLVHISAIWLESMYCRPRI